MAGKDYDYDDVVHSVSRTKEHHRAIKTILLDGIFCIYPERTFTPNDRIEAGRLRCSLVGWTGGLVVVALNDFIMAHNYIWELHEKSHLHKISSQKRRKGGLD